MATLKRADPSARLTKLKCLGEGSYGAVYKMKDELTGDNVAVKVVPVEKDLEDLMNEIKILKQKRAITARFAFPPYASTLQPLVMQSPFIPHHHHLLILLPLASSKHT